VAWHALPAAEAVAALDSGPGGLNDDEARRRLEVHGPNQLPEARPEPLWKIILRQLRSAVAWLLLAGLGLSLLVGDVPDAIAIGVVLLLNVGIGSGMEAGARNALRALRALETPHALVVRGGAAREIEARWLVPGDVVVLEEGAVIPADARLLESSELHVQEAMLTGESLPVAKEPDATADVNAPLPDRRTMLYQGTPVVTGRGRALVVATGAETELGRIGALARGVRPSRTMLERKLDTLGVQLAVVSVALALVVVAHGLARGVEVGELLQLGIALAVATVPEGLPVVATIALAVGVRRMARQNALVRNLPSVESLGAATVVCTDKTGTLTAGQMTVTTLWSAGRVVTVSGSGFAPAGELAVAERAVDAAADPALRRLLRCGALSARAHVEHDDGQWRAVGDPTDAALVVAAIKGGIDPAAALRDAPMAWEMPFSSSRMYSASAHRIGGATVVLVKGAPRAMLDRCTAWAGPDGEVPLDDEGRARLQRVNDVMAADGLRVIALAEGMAEAPRTLPGALTFLGLAAMADPPAPGVPAAIAALREAGVRTVMVTGDQRATGEAISRQLGMLGPGDEGIDARALEPMPDEVLDHHLPRLAVFSRVSPEDKLRIVGAFQRRGDLVAMLGDGVNDAAALRRADVGVAMGQRGTDVAREAADAVLLDDRFTTIVAAVEQGRVIHDNLRKFVYYLVSCNLAEMLTIVALPVLGLPVPFTPLQILWLNLVTDTIPALALAAEPSDPLVMRRPPHPPQRALLTTRLLASAGWHAALLAAVTIAAFWLGLRAGHPAAGTLTFLTLAAAQVLHLGNARSPRPVLDPRRALANRFAVLAVGACALLLAATVHLPVLARTLSLQPIDAMGWILVISFGAVPALIGQLWRAITARRAPRR
jgi:Ca2+-transporting ATPase